MIEAQDIIRYRGGFDAIHERSPSIFTDIGWVTLDSIVVTFDGTRDEINKGFDGWLKRESWRAIDHLVRIAASPADIWMCIEHAIRRGYAPWRPYAAAHAIADIDLERGIEPKRSPFDAFDRADIVFLDVDDRIVVGVWTSIIASDADNRRTPFFSILPALQGAPGIDDLRICIDGRLSNAIRYDGRGVLERVDPNVAGRIEWHIPDAVPYNGIWIARRPGRVSFTTGDRRRLDLALNGNQPLFAPNIDVSDILDPEMAITPESAIGALLYIPKGADATTAARRAIERWVRHAASLAEWRHDVEEGIDVAGDVLAMLTGEVERRVNTIYQEK